MLFWPLIICFEFIFIFLFNAVGLQGESVGRAVAVGLIAAVVGGGLVPTAALVHLELNCLDTYTVNHITMKDISRVRITKINY